MPLSGSCSECLFLGGGVGDGVIRRWERARKVGNRGRGFEGYYQVPGSSCLQLLGSPQQQQPLTHTSAVMSHEVHLLKMYTMTWIQRGAATSHGNDVMTGYLTAEKIVCALSFSLLRWLTIIFASRSTALCLLDPSLLMAFHPHCFSSPSAPADEWLCFGMFFFHFWAWVFIKFLLCVNIQLSSNLEYSFLIFLQVDLHLSLLG